jgi:hypothetical protein
MHVGRAMIVRIDDDPKARKSPNRRHRSI